MVWIPGLTGSTLFGGSVGGVGGSGLELVGQEIVTSGSDSLLQVTGLDLANYIYFVDWRVNAVATVTAKMSINNEATESGYSRRTAAKAETNNTGAISQSLTNGVGANGYFILSQQKQANGNYIWLAAHTQNFSSLDIAIAYKVTGAQVNGTSVEIYGTSNTFGVNSHLKVFKLNSAVLG